MIVDLIENPERKRTYLQTEHCNKSHPDYSSVMGVQKKRQQEKAAFPLLVPLPLQHTAIHYHCNTSTAEVKHSHHPELSLYCVCVCVFVKPPYHWERAGPSLIFRPRLNRLYMQTQEQISSLC